ncbi:MAG: GDP-mannose 4,6-dehydratase [Deltaproteobacteria bacterium]|nr:GDP-mannose 4,6-dehydratase [Deltaproteobacteria bacterium]
MGKRVLITGAAGFAGSHLAERLCAGGHEVIGTHLDDNVENVSGLAGLKLVKCDLLDNALLTSVIKDVRPDVIFHLAAQSSPSISYSNPAETLRVNIFSTLNLFEALANNSTDTVVINAGSGDEYGEAAEHEMPLSETSELRPANPYALSKVAVDLMAYQYWKSRGVKAVRCRPFNHLGPRQSPNFAASFFAKQTAEIEAGLNPENVIKVGNLEGSKDFLDVRDVISAYELLMDKGVYGEVYNVCSGKAIKIRFILETLLAMSSEKIEVVQDAQRMRGAEAKSVWGSNAKIRNLGWVPVHSVADGLKMVLDYWRGKLRRAAQ